MEHIAKNIRALRLQKGLTLKTVASRLNLSATALSNIETNCTNITIQRLQQLAIIYEVTLVELITTSEIHNPQKESCNCILLAEAYRQIIDLQKKLIAVYERRTFGKI